MTQSGTKSKQSNQISTRVLFHSMEHVDFCREYSEDELAELYTHAFTLRGLERFLQFEYAKGRIRGFCHLTIGQEGLYAVLKTTVSAHDHLICSYRCHGAAYAMNLTLKEIICENMGTRQGNSRGKGGSMHLYGDRFYGGHGIVGAQVPLGAGIAFSLKYRKTPTGATQDQFKAAVVDGVCFCIYGDGASNQGQVYETFNMAKIYNLPIVFIVENNRYGMYTAVEKVSVDDCFYKRGYGIPGMRVDDTVVPLLKDVILHARAYALASGPIIVQIDTFRLCGHSTLDVGKCYMDEMELEKRKTLDGIAWLERNQPEERTAKIQEEVAQELKRTVDGIDYEDIPGPEELYSDLLWP